MKGRAPQLELLLRGGDLLALTRLDYHALRARMRAVLRGRLPRHTQRDAADPGLALLDALAACLDVMGFYHDRILTESKLGSAQLLESIARLGAAVGYRPLPALAATSTQFFEAASAGTVLAGTRVGGPGAVFATTSTIEISPAFNRMSLSPVLTLQAGAVRAVLQRLELAPPRAGLEALRAVAAGQADAPEALPTDELRRGMMAMLDSEHGLELCPLAGARRRGVAFARPLLHSHDDRTTLARATRVRHLRFAQPLDDSLVVFEVSELPILHLPSPAKPEEVSSTLELFVFDEPPASPEDWDAKAAWAEVADFSASKVTDRHYRTFVDDRLTTYVVLRRKLGYRTLLEDDRLQRVYARYTPAIGRVVEPPTPPGRELLNLDEVTLRLDRDYLATSLVRPRLAGAAGLHNEARWAVTKADLGLARGAQLAVFGGASGATHVRTLLEVRERYLRWSDGAAPRQAGRPANEHEPIDDFFDPAKGKIAPLAEVASGQRYPLWDAFYKQARRPETDADWQDPPLGDSGIPADGSTFTSPEQLEQLKRAQRIVYLAKGSTFLLLDDGAHVKVGDSLLVGRRLRRPFQRRRPPQVSGAEPAPEPPDESSWFDTHQPWLTAEVVQVLEVHGDLVRLKEPISQDYHQDRLPGGAEPITEVIVVPRVASVYYGDVFVQQVKLTDERTFIKLDSSVQSNYTFVYLDEELDPTALRRTLGLSGEARAMFSQLFLAIEGKLSEPVLGAAWSFTVTVPASGLPAEQVAALRLGALEVTGPVVANATGGLEITFTSVNDAIVAKHHPGELQLVPKESDALAWAEESRSSAPLTAGQFRVRAQAGWALVPAALADQQALLAVGGTLRLRPRGKPARAFSFAWDPAPASPSPRLRLDGVLPGAPRPVAAGELDAVALPAGGTFAVGASAWTADWRLPAQLFPHQASWSSTSALGWIALDRAGGTRELELAIAGAHLELRGVALAPGSPIDPLSGAMDLWALPDLDALPVTADLVTSVWRFELGAAAVSGLGAAWRGGIAVEGSGGGALLSAARVELPEHVQAELPGDVSTTFPSQVGAVHALLAEPVLETSLVRKDVWQWSGAPPFDPPQRREGMVVFTFEPSPEVFLADVWWDDAQPAAPKVLRLIPKLPIPSASPAERELGAIAEVHPEQVLVISDTPGDPNHPAQKPRVITFELGASGPDVAWALATKNLVVTRSDQSLQIVPVRSVLLENGVLTAKVDGDRQEPWSELRLALRDGGAGEVSRRGALRVSQPAWEAWVPRADLGLFFLAQPVGGGEHVPLPPGSTRVAALGTLRSDGLWFAPAAQAEAFPPSHALYLSPRSATQVAAGGRTDLRVNPRPAPLASFSFLGVRDPQARWHPHQIAAITLDGGRWVVRLDERAPAVFPDGLTASSAVRLAHDYTRQPGALSEGLRLRAAPAPALPGVAAVSCALLHDQDLLDGEVIPASAEGDAVHLEVDPNDVFTPLGHPRPGCARLSLGVHWSELPEDRLSPGALLLELGPLSGGALLELEAQDELVLLHAGGGPSPTQAPTLIEAVTAGVYDLGLAAAPTGIRLGKLRAPLEALTVQVSLPRPLLAHEPWLLTFTAPDEPVDDLAEALLFHDGSRLGPDGRLTFELIGTAMLGAIAANKALRYYTNEVGQLHKELYAGALTGASGADNFLLSDGSQRWVDGLLATASAASFPIDRPPVAPRVLLCSTSGVGPIARGGGSASSRGGYVTGGTGPRESRHVAIPVLSESIVFHSGDFIPVTGTLEERDDKVIRNALRVWLLDEELDELQLVTYEPRLSTIVELFDAGNSWEQVYDELQPTGEIKIAGLTRAEPSLLLYSFNKALGGAFTLNFLLIDTRIPTGVRPTIGVYVEYSADRLEEPRPEQPQDPQGRIYQFETALLRLDPTTQLVVLDKGELKTGDYLFLHVAHQALIFWTQIRSITGLVLDVEPALPFELDPDSSSDVKPFRTYALHGQARPPRPAELDQGYYAQTKGAELGDPASLEPLALADRLVLDPVAGQRLLEAIVPHDRLLIWDERYREAWHRHRMSPSAEDPGAEDPRWREWPDAQVEAVVKQVDAATGLIVLSEPLPARFALAFSLVDHPAAPWRTLEPAPLTLRVLPHHRAPFQGPRRLLPLGSGDKLRRFARFGGALGPEVGLGSIPLAGAGLHASNVEVLARDPRSGDWSRWTEVAALDVAEKKDRAFTLGVDASKIGTGQPVPFSVSFGDGERHGQLLPSGERNVWARATAIGGRGRHVAARRPLLLLAARTGVPLPFELLPHAHAAGANLWLLIETGAPERWSPAGRRLPWQPALEIEVPPNQLSREGAAVAWREISRAEACEGRDGFLVRGVRPGVVEVFFFAPYALEPVLDLVRAWEVPDARQWALDADFYAELARQDLTRLPGATRLQLLETDGLARGSLLALSQAEAGPCELVRIDSVDPDTWSATLAEPLASTYALGASFLRGNLAPILQGDTERVVLGSGDGSTAGLRLAVYSRAPLLHALLPGRTDPEPQLEVLVDGAPWTRVPALDDDDLLPRDRVYRVDVEADGRVFVAFGDGVLHGAVPGAGNSNLVARLRTGDGGKGNLPAGALRRLVDGNLAVKNTWNLTEATGGRSGDSPDQARATLLGRSVELDRVVSLEDVARLAREIGEVRDARVDPTAPPEILRLVVALAGRRALSEALREAIVARLAQLLPATSGLTLQVEGAAQVPVYLVAGITVGVGYDVGEVLAALRRAFRSGDGGFFAEPRCFIAEPLRLGDVYDAIFAVPGITAARVTWMSAERPPTSFDEPAPDTVDPGPGGVLRCDQDPGRDPEGDRGTVTFFPMDSGGAS